MNKNLEEYREKRQQRVGGILKYFNTLMGAFYIVMAFVVYFYPFIDNMDNWAKTGISLLLLVYGSFRLWNNLKK